MQYQLKSQNCGKIIIAAPPCKTCTHKLYRDPDIIPTKQNPEGQNSDNRKSQHGQNPDKPKSQHSRNLEKA